MAQLDWLERSEIEWAGPHGSRVHFEIHCGDLDRAERFYTEVFGWHIDHWEGGPIDYRLITTGPDEEPRTTAR